MDTRAVGSWIRTVLTVTVVTLAVWLLAESRMVQTRSLDLRVALIGQPGDPERPIVVRPAPGAVAVSGIELELEGSLASLDAASDELGGAVQLRVGREIPLERGTHTIDLRAVMRQHPVLGAHGVSVRSISSERLVVEVDELIETELAVRVVLPEGTRLEGSARADPESVTVRGPRTILDAIGGAAAVAAPSDPVLESLTPGQFRVIPSVGVELPTMSMGLPDAWVPTVDPARVEVRLTLASRTSTMTIDRIPIQVLIAPGESGRWSVRLEPGDEDLVGIELEGPSDALALVAEGTVSPVAAIELSFQELERGIEAKEPRILGLPQGVRIRSSLSPVGLSIERVEPVAPGGAPGG